MSPRWEESQESFVSFARPRFSSPRTWIFAGGLNGSWDAEMIGEVEVWKEALFGVGERKGRGKVDSRFREYWLILAKVLRIVILCCQLIIFALMREEFLSLDRSTLFLKIIY